MQKKIHEMLNKGSHCRDPKAIGRAIYQRSFSRREKKIGEPTSNKLETPKSVHTIPALQDGWFALFSKHSKEGRLYVQTEFEGRIFFSSIKSRAQKIFLVSLFWETLRVSLPLILTRLSTKNFYKITQNSGFNVTSTEILIIIYLDNNWTCC